MASWIVGKPSSSTKVIFLPASTQLPTVTDVKVSLDSSIPIKVTDENQVHINAGMGDSVSVMITVADNLGADTVPFAGIYTKQVFLYPIV